MSNKEEIKEENNEIKEKEEWIEIKLPSSKPIQTEDLLVSEDDKSEEE